MLLSLPHAHTHPLTHTLTPSPPFPSPQRPGLRQSQDPRHRRRGVRRGADVQRGGPQRRRALADFPLGLGLRVPDASAHVQAAAQDGTGVCVCVRVCVCVDVCMCFKHTLAFIFLRLNRTQSHTIAHRTTLHSTTPHAPHYTPRRSFSSCSGSSSRAYSM
jgi:hypothetical protein